VSRWPRELEALLLDAGNTVVFLDHDAVAQVVRDCGRTVDARLLAQNEGRAKRRYEGWMREGMSHEDAWGLYLTALLEEGGVPDARELVTPLRRTHDQFNLWRRVPEGLPDAIARARRFGLRVGIVSNSEGKLPELFARVGLGDAFEIVVDSAHEGVRKPDPEIFVRATQRMGIDPARALYAGDIPDVDVLGARSAGLHAALIDPLDFYPDHVSSPRYASVVALVDELTSAR
jgi:putative hydrolase of the HAD superfamily